MPSQAPLDATHSGVTNPQAGLTASVVSHGQMHLVNALIGDLIRHGGPSLQRLVVTLNVPEAEPVRVDGARFEVLVLRNDRAGGFGANHNRAFAHCKSAWFAVLNPDIRLSSDALGLLLAARQAKDGLIAPQILNADSSPADSARRLPTPPQVTMRRLLTRRPRATGDYEWMAGMCLLLNSEAFRSMGGFDERYFMYCEDTDLCLRMQLAGWHLRLVPSVQVVHDARRASHRSARHFLWHTTSLIRLWTSAAYWSYLRRRHRLAGLRQTGPEDGAGA
jgi:hypothetical protein